MLKIKQASRRRFHFIYKTTNLVNEKYYIGMHSTDNLEDGYMGSGTRLCRSINKHGKDNHQVEILEFLPDRESLKKRELELVNEEKLTDKMCMNLIIGGEGSWFYVNTLITKEQRIHNAFLGNNSIRRDRSSIARKIAESKRKKGTLSNNGSKSFLGKQHTQETKQKISDVKKQSESQLGEKNSQFGMMWITNGVESKKIKKTDLIPEEWRKGRKMINNQFA